MALALTVCRSLPQRNVGRGLSNHEIAQHLHISEGTIKTHVSALLTTLQLKNRVQLAILAQQTGSAAPARTEGP